MNNKDLSADALGKDLAEALDEIDALRGNQLVLARQCKALHADATVMAMRLMGESDDSFSPETRDVMKRWRPIVMTELQKSASRS